MLIAVVLAAGKGARMQSDIPKVLHLLLGAPLLEHVLDAVEGLRPAERIVVVGHGRERVKAAFAGRSILWADQEEQLGTGHAASCGVERISTALLQAGDPDVLVLNGDLPLLRAATLEAIVAQHRRARADATILTCDMANPFGYGRVLRGPDGKVQGIVEEKDADPATRARREVNVGTYVFRASAFREHYQRIDRSNAQGELYLTDVVVQAARAGRIVETHRVSDEQEVAQVNSRVELAQAGAILRRRLLEDHMAAGVTIDDPASTYVEKGVKIGRDTRLLPFTVIERGVVIGAGCEVGPFTHLRPGTQIDDAASLGNFVEVKNSRVGRRTKIRHLSYIGDGILGEDVNVGAGTIFANYDGKTKSTTIVKDGAFLGSGTVLVAPLTVGKGAVTGAGSVVLKNRDIGDGEVVIGVPARVLKKV
jgi:bifunctional UDP-N-acetylglucosamine pyrophosphorylase/glucosamine-1-phosphate N-acetyltransferase